MKVKRENFVPIVITIETEEEAKALWHRLNHSFWSDSYLGCHNVPVEIREKAAELWFIFDSVYNLKEEA